TVLENGNVGIGTDSPGAKLEVVNGTGIKITNSAASLLFLRRTSSLTSAMHFGNDDDDIYLGLGGDEKFHIATTDDIQASSMFTIQQDGNVGIGTDSPTRKLFVEFTDTTDYSSGGTILDGILIGNTQANTGGGGALTFLGEADDTAQAVATITGVVTSADNMDLVFETEGSGTRAERMRINSSGNVGIGTSSPDGILHTAVSDTSNIFTLERVDTSIGTDNIIADIKMKGGETTLGTVGRIIVSAESPWSADSSPAVMRFFTNPSGATNALERMRIDSSGNVGIGTDSPGKKFTIAIQDVADPGSTAIQTENLSGTPRFALNNLNDGGWTTYDYYGGSYNSGITQKDGNVGIGDSSPTDTLHVQASAGNQVRIEGTGVDSDAEMHFDNDAQSWSIGIDGSDSNSLKLSTGVNVGTGDKVTIQSGGNVGIGETSPEAKLHIKKADTGQTPPVTSNMILEDTAATNYFTFLDATANSIQGLIMTDGAGADGYVIYDSDGKGMRFQSGTDEVARFWASGGFAFGDTFIDTDPGVDNMIVEGNVGIGTSSPDRNLDILSTSGTADMELATNDVQNSFFKFTSDKDGTGMNGFIGIDYSEDNFKITRDGFDGSAKGIIIDGDGEVGIGTSTPSEKLEVLGNVLQSPIDPVLEGSLGIGGNPYSVYVSGRYAYVVDIDSDDLKIIDISDPSSPSLSGSLSIGAYPRDVYVSGKYAYVVDSGSDDLKIIDISNPSLPTLAGSLSIGTDPHSIYVSGKYAYVVYYGSDDLKIIDISNPSLPTLTGSLSIGSGPLSVYVSGKYAYVIDYVSRDLKVIDISDPSSPSLSGSLGVGSNPVSIYVSGSYAYVVDTISDDLKIIDVSDPSSPSLSGSLSIGASPRDVYVSGKYAYVVDSGSDDLKIIDISNPSLPTLAGSLGIGGSPYSVYVSGRYAYVIDTDSDDLKVIDISGMETTSMIAHSLEAGNLQVRNDIIAQGQLQVTGGITAGSGGIYSTGPVGVFASTTAAALTINQHLTGDLLNVFDNTGSEIFTIEEGGNVGIGDSTPTYQLTLSTDSAYKLSSGTWSYTSDEKLKDINGDFTRGLEALDDLYPVYFNFKKDNEIGALSDREYIGLIAQDIQKTVPEAVTQGEDGYLKVEQDAIMWTMLNAIKELNLKVGEGFSNIAENFGIGTPIAYRKLHIEEASDNPQVRVAYDEDNFAEMQVSAAGDLAITTQGADIRFPDENVSICSGGACSIDVASMDGTGNLAVENIAFVAGALGVGTSEPQRVVDIFETYTDPQLRISYDEDLYSEFNVSATGDLVISAEGGDISVLDENFKICSGKGCPKNADELKGTGNLLVENNLLALGNVGINTTSPSYTLDVNGTLRAKGITDASDERLKKNIQSLSLDESVLAKVLKLRGVSYNWRDNESDNSKPTVGQGQIGLIAQELEREYPELVDTDKEGFKSIQYGKFTAVLLEAVKEIFDMSSKIEYRSARLENKMVQLEKENQDLQKGILKLENRIKILEEKMI
ncbi:MAG: tail fiber domain-containing protein, partial [Candidatus Pacebacteria bacterium]|nr:tail fiber domain-containing protein [Candidatus Paceibacterota bacterium]